MIAFLIAAVAVAGVAAIYDLRTGHIPNWLTLGSLALAFAANAIFGFATGGFKGTGSALVAAFIGMLICSIVPGILFAKGGMGGGDLKLFAAIGAACHMKVGLEAETLSFVVALLLAPAYLAWKGTLLRTLANTAMLVVNPFRPKASRRDVPSELMSWFRLAPAIFLGCVVSLLNQTIGF
jgi:prepilin peptidase CpaA